MPHSRTRRGALSLALAALVVAGAVVGCGDAGNRARAGSAAVRAEAVVVTYYYLPG